MKMEKNYGSIKIKSNWFDWNNKKRKILKIGHEGLDMYFTLGKYRLARTSNTQEYTFHVSIDLLRKATKYSTKKITELLKLLINQKIIMMKKPVRWDRLLDDKEMITFVAIDVPKTDWVQAEGDKTPKDKPRTDDDYYISVDLDVLEYYKAVGLNGRYFSLYCLFRKLSNGTERKAYMTIHNMAETLGMHHDTIHKYIKELNKKMLLCSYKTFGKKGSSYFEHILSGTVSGHDGFLRAHKEIMIKNAKRWESKDSDKAVIKSSDDNDLDVEIVAGDSNENFEYSNSELPLENVGADQYEQVYTYH